MTYSDLSPQTTAQISAITIAPDQPLIICDVDEVVVHFLAAFESHLANHNYWLDPVSIALNGNIRKKIDNQPLPSAAIGPLIDSFFAQHTASLTAIDGAVTSLTHLSAKAQIIMLSNLPQKFADARRQNLNQHGLDFPLVLNSGGKGPAVAKLAANHQQPVIFIDDLPSYLTSVQEHVPSAHLIHFAHDPRFARHAPPMDFLSQTANNWQDTLAHIETLLTLP